MPSKTRSTRATKASKENTSVSITNKVSKAAGKALKGARKPLSDKTNSASDDNASSHSEKLTKPVTNKKIKDVCEDYIARPRRARRLPTRYKENSTLVNLSNSFNSSGTKPEFQIPERKTNNKAANKPATQDAKKTVLAKKKASPVKIVNKSPVKTDCSLLKSRPKRICRLPTKYDNHLISPNKYIPLQPINASTPLATKTKKVNKQNNADSLNVSPVLHKKVLNENAQNNGMQKTVADTNNNAKKNKDQKSPNTSGTPDRIFKAKASEKALNKNTSIRLLDDKNQKKRDSSKLDVYEFTFDPEEEPRPAKKKKKQAPKRPKPKTKTVTIKSNYDKNLAKALAALKNAVTSKPSSDTVEQKQEVATTVTEHVDNKKNHITNTPAFKNNKCIVTEHNMTVEKNYNSVRVEDIARDFQIIEDDHSIDYSPVTSPCRPKTPDEVGIHKEQTPNIADPLNLRGDLSFFDEVPVACSSMNVSVRHPQASPWRAEFGSLPIKWQVNTYVKANMTPAIESSFINFNDSHKKKHVYTDMVPQVIDSLPQGENSNLKQTSILSFIKEVVEKNANKKNKKSTPIKTDSLFEDLKNTSVVHQKSPNKLNQLNNNTNVQITPDSSENHDNNTSDMSTEKEQSANKENSTETIKTPNKNKKADKNNTYFGFDDTEDQENVSPIKINNKAISLRSHTRGILQEINDHKGPTRAIAPVAAKFKNRYRNEIKPATEPPVFPKVTVDSNTNNINTQESCMPESLTNDDQSVHLFEDLDLLEVHHPKPNRKSYGKAKKVAFTQKPVVHSDDSSTSDVEDKAIVSSEEDNLDDLSFKLPSEKPKRTIKKKKSKKLLSKKEEKEVEAWAAGFNSMCEDIDGFDLIVE